MATITSTEAGAVGRYINLGSPSSQDDIGAQTVIAYCKPTGVPASTAGYLMAKTTSGSNNALRFAIVDSGSGPKASIAFNSTGAAGTPNRIGTPNEVTYGVWQHLAFTWDGAVSNAELRLYIGGIESTYAGGGGSGTGSVVSDAANDLFLMNRGNASALARDWIGDVGYIARWNRVLNSTERATVRSDGPLAVPSGLILCWANNQDYSSNALTPTARTTFVAGSTPTNTALGGSTDGSVTGGTGTGTSSGTGGDATGINHGFISGGTGVGTGSGTGGDATGVSTIELSVSYERSSAVLSESSIVGGGDSAIISISPKTQEGEASTPNIAWADPSCDVIGMNGIRPTFRFLKYKGTDGGLHGFADGSWPSTRRPMFSYDDGLTWTYFDNCTPSVGSQFVEFRHGTAFTQNKIRVSKSRQTTVHQVGDWLEALALAHPFVVPTATAAGYTPSGAVSDFSAQAFIADEFSSQIDSIGTTIPETPFYAAEINDTSLIREGALPKRFAAISSCVHSGENISVPAFRAMVEYLCGTSTEAQNIRRNYRVLVYPCMNAPGLAGGGVRGSWTQGVGGVDDPSRNFSSIGTGLEVVDIPRTVMDADRGETIPDWFLDLHGMYNNYSGYHSAIYIDDSNGLTERYRVHVSALESVTMPVMGSPMPAGAVSRYFKTQGVKMAVSLEQGDSTPVSDSFLLNHGIALADGISALIDEGAFFAVVTGGTGTGTGSGAGGDATGQIAGEVSGGVGTGTGTGAGGDAVGEVGGSASVTGGTGTGIGSGAGGDATGVVAGEVTGGTGVGVGSGTGGDATGASANAYVTGGIGTGYGSGYGGGVVQDAFSSPPNAIITVMNRPNRVSVVSKRS